MKKFLAIFLLMIAMPTMSFSWDGYDMDTGESVEIEKGNLVRPGNTIDVYDYGTEQYHVMDVESIQGGINSVEIEVYDHETGETRYLEMDAD